MREQIVKIGRLLRADNRHFVVGCHVSQISRPAYGALVKAPVEQGFDIYGLIYEMRIDDDGLVRQLVTAEGLDENIIADNRLNRNVPLEMSVLAVGYRQGTEIRHLLPPRPPLSLDEIHLCSPDELYEFSNQARFGYFRHILRLREHPLEDLFAAHLAQAHQAHLARGEALWIEAAMQELITLLRDDYALMMNMLSALSDLRRSLEH